ncbi:MAG TPA: ABC transporter family substrate-binding protein [Microlunatus sp.]|nr:ABC transporter family substrate-binding protein [Microlunatus sp.]
MKARKILVAPFVAGALVLSACGGGGGDAGGGSEPAESIAPISSQDINIKDRGELAQGGTVRLSIADFGSNWNPNHVDGNNNGLSQARRALIPQFFNFDPKGVPSPNPDWVVSAEETNANPTTVNFKLNPKAVWGDGSPVDADDMTATWKACNGENKEFNCAATQGYDQIASITTGADKFDVTVTFKSTYPDWTQPFSYPGTLKAESVKDVNTFNTGWKNLNNDWLSGPFKVASFDNSQKVLTEVPNEKWWGEKPLLDTITFRAISPDANAAAFANNELDAFDIGPDPDAYQRVKGVSDASIRQAAGPNFRQFTFNTKAGVLTDQKVRQAIVKGLDREAIGASDLAGIDWPVQPLNNNILLQNQEGYADVAKETGIDFDPEAAKADLDALGWTAGSDGIREKDGKKLAVKFAQLSGVPVSANEALQAQNMLKEIGVKVDVVDVPVAKFQDGSVLSQHEFEIIAFSWIGTPYPFFGISQIYGTGSDSNYSQLSVPEIDENAKLINSETDKAKRIDLTNQTAKIIWENVMTLPLYQRPELTAVKTKLANYGSFGLSNPQWENVGYEK